MKLTTFTRFLPLQADMSSKDCWESLSRQDELPQRESDQTSHQKKQVILAAWEELRPPELSAQDTPTHTAA